MAESVVRWRDSLEENDIGMRMCGENSPKRNAFGNSDVLEESAGKYIDEVLSSEKGIMYKDATMVA